MTLTRGTSWILASILTAVLVTLAIALGHLLHAREAENVLLHVDGAHSTVEHIVTRHVSATEFALARMASRLARTPEMTRDVWQVDATRYLREIPGLLAISWASDSGGERWRVNVFESLPIDMDASGGAPEAETPATVQWIPRLETSWFDAWFRVDGDARKGWVWALFDVQRWLSRVLEGEEVVPGYAIELAYEDRTLFRRSETRPAPEWTIQAEIPGPANWRLGVWPTSHQLARLRTLLPHVVLSSTIALALLAGLSVGLARTAKRRARLLQIAYSELQALSQDLDRKVEERTTELSQSRSAALALAHEADESRHRAENTLRDLRTSEEKLKRTAQELARRNRELDDFASVVSHDLKAPLRGISSIATWTLDDYGDRLDEEGRQSLELLRDRANRMDRFINAILDYSRTTRTAPELVSVDTQALVEEVVSVLDPPAEIEVRIQGPLPTVPYDATQLEQVFQNLIGNAIRHLGKPAGTISVSAEKVDGHWMFQIRDTGVGIEEQHFERIFKIFQTLKPRDEVDSTGVGLSLVKRIVEHHGGTVQVESEPGSGSVFSFTVLENPESERSHSEARDQEAVR